MAPSAAPLGFCGSLKSAFCILGGAVAIPFRQCTLFLPVLLVVVLVPRSLLFAADFLLSYSPPRSLDPRLLTAVQEAILPLATYLVLLLTTLATIHASSSSAHHATGDRPPSLAGLLCRFCRQWKDPALTWVYVTLLDTGATYFVNSVFNSALYIAQGAFGLMAVGYLLYFAAYLLYVFLAVAWKTALVVSVVEGGGSGGLRALGSAEGLVRGRWLSGFIVSAVLLVVSLVVTGARDYVSAVVPPTVAAQLEVGLAMAIVGWVLDVLTLVAFTVFYYECRKAKAGVPAVDGEDGYSPLPASSDAAAAAHDGGLP